MTQSRTGPYLSSTGTHAGLARAGRTPLVAWSARIKARPEPVATPTHFRVRLDRVDGDGRVTLRYLSQLRHIYVGRAHRRERVRLLVADAHVRVLRENGELLLAAAPVHNVLRQVSSMS